VHRNTDVFVVGGGPAGLAAAIAAARKGFSVTVADGSAPPIDKPCGEGLMPEAQAALKSLGVVLPESAGRKFRGIRFLQNETEVSAEFPLGQGLGIRRPVLHGLLIEAAEKLGIRLLWKASVQGIESGTIHLTEGSVSARWIIGADGGASRVRKWAGLDSTRWRRERMASRRHFRVRPWSDYMEIYWGKRAQAYVTPISADEVCIVLLGDDASSVKFDDALKELPRLHSRIAGAELGSRERGAVTATHRLSRVVRGNVALIGDASGGVDAITGDGLRLAFRQAAALAGAMETGDLRPYQLAHQALQRRPQTMGRLMVELGRRQGIRQRVLGVMSRRPALFERMLAIHVGRATSWDILAASAQMTWQFLGA